MKKSFFSTHYQDNTRIWIWNQCYATQALCWQAKCIIVHTSSTQKRIAPIHACNRYNIRTTNDNKHKHTNYSYIFLLLLLHQSLSNQSRAFWQARPMTYIHIGPLHLLPHVNYRSKGIWLTCESMWPMDLSCPTNYHPHLHNFDMYIYMFIYSVLPRQTTASMARPSMRGPIL